MSARIEVQAPVRQSLRGYVWGSAALLLLLTALLIWNLTGRLGTATQKFGTTAPVTKTVERTQTGLISTGGATHPRAYEGIVVPVPAGGGGGPGSGYDGGGGTSPQQR